MRIQPSYLRLYTDAGVELTDSNYRHTELDWEMPSREAALVCLDCWNWHFSRETLERIGDCTRRAIVPLLAAARAAGMNVIHAPADPVAQRHPNWARLLPEDATPQPPWPDSPAWPPDDFRKKVGEYARYARPFEPQRAEREDHRRSRRTFHEHVRPEGDEAVVLSGEELHRLCAARGILHLFYVGFNTNACVMMRDYGLPAMSRRGYHVILVRDATTGMETSDTIEEMICTRGAIADIEQFIGYTVASTQLVAALDEERDRQAGSDG